LDISFADKVLSRVASTDEIGEQHTSSAISMNKHVVMGDAVGRPLPTAATECRSKTESPPPSLPAALFLEHVVAALIDLSCTIVDGDVDEGECNAPILRAGSNRF
jgi:hypothetical protein